MEYLSPFPPASGAGDESPAESPERILFFLKAPRPGTVKTRLAAELGPEAAALLYRAMAEDTLAALHAAGAPVTACYAPADAGPEVAAWLGPDLDYAPQRGDGLGARMLHAFEEAFARGARRAVLVGSDLPDLPPGRVAEALRLLAGDCGPGPDPVPVPVPVPGLAPMPPGPVPGPMPPGPGRTPACGPVFGPAEDGGYYLAGFTPDSLVPECLTAPPMSRPDTLARTLAVLRARGVEARLLAAHADLDRPGDLARAAQSPGAARLRAALAGLGL
jgi:glycosyltransferase A (GT-A) superfamily protein (DUF2064 family)